MGYLVASEIDQQTIDIIEDNILTKPTLQCLESMVQRDWLLKFIEVSLILVKLPLLKNCLKTNQH